MSTTLRRTALGPGAEWAMYLLSVKDSDLRRRLFAVTDFGDARSAGGLSTETTSAVSSFFRDTFQTLGKDSKAADEVTDAVLRFDGFRLLLYYVWKNQKLLRTLDEEIFKPTGLYSGSGAHPGLSEAGAIFDALNKL